MTHPTDILGRAVRRGLATVVAASLLWTTAFLPAQAEEDPSAPPEEITVTTEATIDPTDAPAPEGEATKPTDPEEPRGEAELRELPTPPRGLASRSLDLADIVEQQEEILAEGLEAEETENEAEQSESISGWVLDDYNFDEVQGIQVQLWRSVGGVGSEMVDTTTTDSTGRYSFSGVASGSYFVMFFGEGFQQGGWNEDYEPSGEPDHFDVDVDGEPVIATAVLARNAASVVGRVTNSANQGLRGIQLGLVEWVDDYGWREMHYYVETDSTGNFAFVDLPVGYYYVDESQLPKNARMAVEGTYLSLLTFWGDYDGLLEPELGQPGTGVALAIGLDPSGGTWKKTTFKYQWLAGGVAITGATQSTYVPSAAVLGKVLAVKVTAKRGNYSFTVTSRTSAPVIRTSVPTIGGQAAVGETLSANAGDWEEGMTLRYQWYADNKAISGATGMTLRLAASQKGKKITVKVTTGFEGYGHTVSRTSAAYGKVATAGTPSVSGTYLVGSTLKAKTGTWTKKTKFSYQWLRDGVAISKATKSSYKLTGADNGKAITVKVTGKLSGYATVAKNSAASVKVLLGATPSISGVAGTGNVLTVNPGTWTAGTAFTQQWYANGKAISGQTGVTLNLTSALAGKKITVKVTGRLEGHASATTTSKAKGKVLLVGTVAVTGTMAEGVTLAAKPGTWTRKTKLSYQWFRGTAKISKATKASYKLTGADVGSVVTVKVTGKLSGYETVTAVGPAGDPVTAATPGG